LICSPFFAFFFAFILLHSLRGWVGGRKFRLRNLFFLGSPNYDIYNYNSTQITTPYGTPTFFSPRSENFPVDFADGVENLPFVWTDFFFFDAQ